MKYSYKAKTKEGKLSRGIIEARNTSEALSSLKENGLFVMDINENDKKGGKNLFSFRKKVALKDKIIFTKELSMMIKSGLSITEALEALAQESNNPYFSEIITELNSQVKGGKSLSLALEKYPHIFPEIYANMVKSGEESGKIEVVLNRLAIQLEKEFDLNRKVKGALAYPVFVMAAIVIVMTLIIVVIIPHLQTIFIESGVELPMSTKLIIGLSKLLREHGILVGIFLLIFGVASSFYFKTPSGRRNFDKTIIKIPVIGELLKKTYISRFTRTFSSLTASGLPLMDVFAVSNKTIGNSIYEGEITAISDKVKNGQLISEAIKESPLMPKMVGQLASVGEKSGTMEEVFDQVADFYDRDIDVLTGNLSTLLEPILMVVMGIGIGFIIISVLQPIYGLVNAV